MKFKIVFMSLTVALFSLLCGNTHASLQAVWLNVWTQTETGLPNKLMITVDVRDNQLSHPPDYVTEIKITAPDTTVLYLHPTNDWLPWDKIYYRGFVASEFVSAIIPGGNYSLRVAHKSGSVITNQKDSVAASFLAPAELTYPTANATGVGETPTFRWNTVKNATFYRIGLFNNTWGEPVYYTPCQVNETDFTSYKIPIGDLKPNCNYKVRIEARASSQDMDMRSRTQWINFTTANW
jgi:hypothetical protein